MSSLCFSICYCTYIASTPEFYLMFTKNIYQCVKEKSILFTNFYFRYNLKFIVHSIQMNVDDLQEKIQNGFVII